VEYVFAIEREGALISAGCLTHRLSPLIYRDTAVRLA